MTVLSQELDELFRYRACMYKTSNPPYTNNELSAQVTAFMALKEMDEREGKEKKVSE